MLDEAQYLLDNAEVIPDPDERLRRDLRHLGSYAVDREGATEVLHRIEIYMPYCHMHQPSSSAFRFSQMVTFLSFANRHLQCSSDSANLPFTRYTPSLLHFHSHSLPPFALIIFRLFTSQSRIL